jgi:hypothetical protein
MYKQDRQLRDPRVFALVKFRSIDFLVVKMCRLEGGYRYFGEIYCVPLHGVIDQNTTIEKHGQTSYKTSIY